MTSMTDRAAKSPLPATRGRYVPRHAAPAPGGFDWSAAERARVHGQRAERAVMVLAATDNLPASRLLYRELLLAGALTPGVEAVA